MKFFKNKKILITGGLGFIGSNLAIELVGLGAKVEIIDAIIRPYGANMFNIKEIKDKVKIIKADIRDYKAVKKCIVKKNYIFHLAGQVSRLISMENPVLDNEINCLGTLNILEAIKNFNPKAMIVFAGSRGEMGNQKSLPVGENDLPLPNDIYGADKLAGEHYLKIYHDAYGIKTVALRINNTYGERCQMQSSHYGIVNLFINYVFENKTIPVYGNGEQTRDYIYIKDLIEAMKAVVISDRTNGKVYFVGSGTETKFIDMVKIVLAVMGRGKYKFQRIPSLLGRIDTQRFACDISRIKFDTKWSPKFDLEQGIKNTVRYYSEYLKYYR